MGEYLGKYVAKSADMTPKPPCDGRLNKLHFPETEDF